MSQAFCPALDIFNYILKIKSQNTVLFYLSQVDQFMSDNSLRRSFVLVQNKGIKNDCVNPEDPQKSTIKNIHT